MMDNLYIYVIVALLPLTAIMSVSQVNPYHALVVRAILGAVAALVYVVLGASDVALTEALVGTMLAIALYIIAVRSSLVVKLGILPETKIEIEEHQPQLISKLQAVFKKYHLRLELIEYDNLQSLKKALENQEIHAICTSVNSLNDDYQPKYETIIRIMRLFSILEQELNSPLTTVTYFSPTT